MHVLRDFFPLQIRLRADTRLYIRVALQKPMADEFVVCTTTYYCKAAEKLLDILIIILLWLFLFSSCIGSSRIPPSSTTDFAARR